MAGSVADAADVRRMRAITEFARREFGIVVTELPGWEKLGATWARTPVGIVDHHDASSRKAGEWGALGVIRYGRDGVPAPLSQFQVARCLDGIPKFAVVAAGRANHAGLGGPYRFADGVTVPRDVGNAWLYGAESANDGLGEPYTAAAHYTHDALFRAVLEVCG